MTPRRRPVRRRARRRLPPLPPPRRPFVGLYFHSFNTTKPPRDGDAPGPAPRWQGMIVDRTTEDGAHSTPQTLFLVQLFEWVTGTPEVGLQLVRADQMIGWTFYRTADDMRAAFGLYDGVRRFLRRRAAGDGDARCPTCGG